MLSRDVFSKLKEWNLVELIRSWEMVIAVGNVWIPPHPSPTSGDRTMIHYYV